MAVDEKFVFKNVPSPNEKIYCDIYEDALLQKFKEKNSQKGFSYLALDDPTTENEDITLVTHYNSLFLLSQISELHVEDGVGVDKSTDNCAILSEDISDYKSACYVGYEQGLDYAIELYAKDQHRVELRLKEVINEGMIGFPADYLDSTYSLVRYKTFIPKYSDTIYTVIFSIKSFEEDPDMKHLVEKEPNNGCYNIIEIEENK